MRKGLRAGVARRGYETEACAQGAACRSSRRLRGGGLAARSSATGLRDGGLRARVRTGLRDGGLCAGDCKEGGDCRGSEMREATPSSMISLSSRGRSSRGREGAGECPEGLGGGGCVHLQNFCGITPMLKGLFSERRERRRENYEKKLQKFSFIATGGGLTADGNWKEEEESERGREEREKDFLF